MKVPTFHVELTKDTKEKTLADIPEWTLAECDFGQSMTSLMRFRIGGLAYEPDPPGSPSEQCSAKGYIVKRIIGRIVCK